MSELFQKPPVFEAGARTISARALNQILSATPRCITGGSGASVSKFGDRVVISSPEQTIATPAGMFPHGKKWPFGWQFSAAEVEGVQKFYLDIFNVVLQVGQGTVRATGGWTDGPTALSIELPDSSGASGDLVSLHVDFSLFPEVLQNMADVSAACSLVWGGGPQGGSAATSMYIPLYIFRGRVMLRDFIHGLCFPQVWLPFVQAAEEET